MKQKIQPTRSCGVLVGASLWLLTVGLAGIETATAAPVDELGASSASAEVRAVWVTRWDFKTREDVERIVRWSYAFGFNRIFLQVRGQADALYRSEIEPWSELLGGTDPGFDPLETALTVARQVGIELHAWVNILPAWKGKRPPKNSQHLLHRRPEWFLVDSKGKQHLTAKAGHYTVINPCLPEVRRYLVEVIDDIASRYAVDGVHFDYIRFVGVDGSTDFSYDPRTLGLFRAYAGATPFDAPEAWHRWRRLAVNTVLYQLASTVRKARPGCVVSVAALPDFDRARAKFFQDAPAWARNGWIDEIFPMSYKGENDDFADLARPALATDTGGVPVYPGVGVYLFKKPHQLSEQVGTVRALGGGGYALFAFTNFFPSASHESRKDPQSRWLRARMRETLATLHDVPSLKPAHQPPSAATPGRPTGAASRRVASAAE